MIIFSSKVDRIFFATLRLSFRAEWKAKSDRLGQLKSTTKCEQSIFSTSTGFVCLDDETKKLLASRGGNASSGEAEIGK